MYGRTCFLLLFSRNPKAFLTNSNQISSPCGNFSLSGSLILVYSAFFFCVQNDSVIQMSSNHSWLHPEIIKWNPQITKWHPQLNFTLRVNISIYMSEYFYLHQAQKFKGICLFLIFSYSQNKKKNTIQKNLRIMLIPLVHIPDLVCKLPIPKTSSNLSNRIGERASV